MSFPRLPVPSGRSSGSAADMVPARAKPPARAIKARKRARAAACVPGSKAARCPCSGVFPKDDSYDGVKILGNGALEKNLTVKAAAFSESAKSKIEAAGGKAEVV